MIGSAPFLARVREALRHSAPKRHLHGHGVLDEDRDDGPADFRAWLPQVGGSWEERFSLFRENAAALKADVVVYRDQADLTDQLQRRSREENWQRIALHRGAWSESALDSISAEKTWTDPGYDRAALEASEVGITECDALVAQTGSVLVTSRSAGGRVLSVLPPHHIVLARHDQLVPDVAAALGRLRETHRDHWPSMMSFITGPSRTGDIERILVLGAHGPSGSPSIATNLPRLRCHDGRLRCLGRSLAAQPGLHPAPPSAQQAAHRHPGVALGAPALSRFRALFYLAVGTERVRHRRRRRQRSFRRKRGWHRVKVKPDLSGARAGTPERNLLETTSRIIGLPTASSAEIHILKDGQAYYDALRRSFGEAKSTLHVESFIWRKDEVGAEFLDLLVAAARRGVRVRLLLDELGCLGLTARYFRPLVQAGGEFSWCHTLYPRHNRYFFNLRNHRKLQVVDGRVAFVGGMNFGREYLGLDPQLGSWSDLQVELRGPVVSQLQQVFAEDWFFATSREDPLDEVEEVEAKRELSAVQVLRTGPDEDDHPMLRVNLALIEAARKRLWISAGYFIPGGTMQTALQVAAARGIDVRLLVSEKSQHRLLVKAGRSYYDALLRQGVRIFEYRRGIEHSKFTVVDDEMSVIGSSNFDDRSMRLNFELSVLIHRSATNRALARRFTEKAAEAKEISRAAFARRPLRERLTESALRLCSPLL